MNTFADHLTAYLLSQSAQVIWLLAVVWLLTRLLRRASAHWRYLLWLIVLLKCLVPPFVTVPVAVLGEVPQLLPVARIATTPPAANAGLPVNHGGPVPAPTAGAAAADHTRFAWSIADLGLGGWAVGALGYLALVAGRAGRIQRDLRRYRTEPDLELECEFVKLVQRSGLRSRPRLCLIAGIGQPFVWGLLRGCIYLPARFSSQGTVEQRRLVLAHELAHVVRWDALVNALQILVQALFWFHPLVWWLNRTLRHEREKCCDEMAIALLRVDSRTYGSAIVERLAAYFHPACPASSLAISGRAKDLEDRLAAITIPGRPFYSRPTLAVVLVTLLLGAVAIPARLASPAVAALAPAPVAGFAAIDLTPVQHRGLDEPLQAGVPGNSLSALTAGRQTLADVPFELTGVTVLTAADPSQPASLELSLNRPVSRLHLLHGVAGTAEPGAAVASMRWHFAGGETRETPLAYGAHVRDWWFWNYEAVTDAGSVMAWTGGNPAVRKQGGSLRLYRTTLANPLPGWLVTRIELAAVEPSVTPFLVAATSELEP